MLTYKYYLTISLAILVSFIVLAAIISPRISDNDDIFSAIIEGDKMTYLQVNNPHFEQLNQIMLLFSQYGRGVAWTLTGVLLFIFGGWTGRKTAIVMAITMLILIPIGTIAKETVGRVRPAMPETELLMAPDTTGPFQETEPPLLAQEQPPAEEVVEEEAPAAEEEVEEQPSTEETPAAEEEEAATAPGG